MKKCTSNDECTTVFDCCCGTSINALFVSTWNGQLSCADNFCSTIDCVPTYAACANGQCVLKEYNRATDYLRCEKDADCICGTDNESGECAIGSYSFITLSENCLNFCTNATSEFSYNCVNNICAPVAKN
jgi:hypothetical protein